ncbi:hypothetical protein AB0K21_31215 [Streptosporangium sp. NPDC049248]|uniref:hypothetical protein n=1 Tax=Streptosporangium sp. NPDC049248 TaxID=3155651 RepID=UPI003430D1EE
MTDDKKLPRAAVLRINKCLRNESDTLDLSHIPLETVPEQLRELTGLRELRLYLTGIPEPLGDLTTLTHLRLDGKLTGLPEWLGDLTDLKQLDVSGHRPPPTVPDSLRRLARTSSRWRRFLATLNQ